MPMIVEGRSKDPKQQVLRDHKRNWNIAAREFAARLRGFKSSMNGKGSVQYGIPPSDIKNPLPSEVGSFMQELVSNFQQLMSEADRIEAEQAAYSANRKKPQEKKLKQPLPPEQEAQPTAPAAPVIPNQEPKKAAMLKQASKKRMGTIRVGEYELPTILAITSEEQEQGLMGVAPPVPVMSFVYDRPQLNSFWMKGTPAPLDIVFALNGKITGIRKGEPYSTRTISTYSPSDLVVEFPIDTCKRLGINEGDNITLIV